MILEAAGSSFQHTVLNGSLLLAVPVAAAAGVVSFLSPCVLPLVPGYIAYATGLSGADLEDGGRRRSGRVLLGCLLFVLGFSVLFVSEGALFGYVGVTLKAHVTLVDRILGVLIIIFGLAFMGFLPGLQREVRIRRLPAAGVAGAPVLGFLFGVGWTPCIGTTLAAVQSLATSPDGAGVGRGALLTLVFSLGLGVPFVVVALLFRRTMGALAFVKRHYAWVTRIGGGLLILVGILLVSGLWNAMIDHLQPYISGYSTVL